MKKTMAFIMALTIACLLVFFGCDKTNKLPLESPKSNVDVGIIPIATPTGEETETDDLTTENPTDELFKTENIDEEQSTTPGNTAEPTVLNTSTTTLSPTSTAVPHIHTLSPKWISDDTYHWKECGVCSEKVEVEEHSFSEWETEDNYIYRYSDDGVRIRNRFCTVCEYKQSEEYTIDYIEVTKLPNVTRYSKYYLPDWTGMELTIHNSNGTVDKVVFDISDDNFTYCSPYGDASHMYFDFNGSSGYIDKGYFENKFYIEFATKTCTVEGISFFEDKEIKNVDINNFSTGGIGTKFIVTYEDGEIENIVVDNILAADMGVSMDTLWVYFKTSKGILLYDYAHYNNMDDPNGLLYENYYTVGIFGKNVDVDKQNIFSTISVGETKTVTIEVGGRHAYFTFIPEENGNYHFYSTSDDTYGSVRDNDMNVLKYADSYRHGRTLNVNYQMTAGNTYILHAFYGGDETHTKTGTFSVTLEKSNPDSQ